MNLILCINIDYLTLPLQGAASEQFAERVGSAKSQLSLLNILLQSLRIPGVTLNYYSPPLQSKYLFVLQQNVAQNLSDM